MGRLGHGTSKEEEAKGNTRVTDVSEKRKCFEGLKQQLLCQLPPCPSMALQTAGPSSHQSAICYRNMQRFLNKGALLLGVSNVNLILQTCCKHPVQNLDILLLCLIHRAQPDSYRRPTFTAPPGCTISVLVPGEGKAIQWFGSC